MIIEPFQPEHIQEIELQAEQTVSRAQLNDTEYLKILCAHESWTARIQGKVVACAGVMTLWPGRYQAWAVISATIGHAGMLRLTKAVRRFVDLKTGRVELVVAADFKAGHRWAQLLGFELETPRPMRRWFPNGGDACLYSRVK